MQEEYIPEYERKRRANEELLAELVPILEKLAAVPPVARIRINYAKDDPAFGVVWLDYKTGNRDYIFIGAAEGIAAIDRIVQAVRWHGTYWNRMPGEYR